MHWAALLKGQKALRACRNPGECCGDAICEELHEQLLQIEAVNVAVSDVFEDKLTATQFMSLFHNHVSYSYDGEVWTQPLTDPLRYDARAGILANTQLDWPPRYRKFWPYCLLNDKAANDANAFYTKKGESHNVEMKAIDPVRYANKTVVWNNSEINVAETIGLADCDKEHVKLGYVENNLNTSINAPFVAPRVD